MQRDRIMKQLFALILSIVFFLIMISCTMDNSSRTKFPWEPAVAAPINYPVETQYTLVGYGTNGRELSVMEQTPRSGISDPSDGAGVLEDDPGFDLPNSLSILWLSCTEQKFYKADINLTGRSVIHFIQVTFSLMRLKLSGNLKKLSVQTIREKVNSSYG